MYSCFFRKTVVLAIVLCSSNTFAQVSPAWQDSLTLLQQEVERGAFHSAFRLSERWQNPAFVSLQENSRLQVQIYGAYLNARLEKWEEAESVFEDLKNKIPEQQSRLRVDHLRYWAWLKIQKDEFTAARTLLDQAMEEVERRTQSSPQIRANLHLLTGINELKDEQFEASRVALNRALHILESEKIRSRDLASAYEFLALLDYYKSRYETGLKGIDEAISIWQSLGWTQHPDYARVLETKGILLMEGRGLLAQAEELFRTAQDINTAFLPRGMGIGMNLGNLAQLYLRLDEQNGTQEAPKLGKASFQVFKKFPGTISYLTAKFNYAYILGVDSLKVMKHIYESVLEEHRQLFGKNKVSYANMLSAYAFIFEQEGDLGRAIEITQEALVIINDQLGTQNKFFASALYNLANLKDYQAILWDDEAYEMQEGRSKDSIYMLVDRQFAEVDSLNRACYAIETAIYGEGHPLWIESTYNLADYFEVVGLEDSALHYYQRANLAQMNLLNQYFAGFDESMQLSYLKKATRFFEDFMSFSLRYPVSSELTDHLLDVELASRNLALRYSNQLLADSINFQEPEKRQVLADWKRIKRAISELTFSRDPGQREILKALNDSLILFDKELRRLIFNKTEFEEPRRPALTNWSEKIRQKLQPEEAVLLFFDIAYSDSFEDYDSTIYAALILTPDEEPARLVQLGPQKALHPFFEVNRQGIPAYVSNIDQGRQLYQMVWGPLKPHLSTANTIHLSAGGLLHKLAFDVLPLSTSSDSFLIDRYWIRQYTDLKDFRTKEASDTVFTRQISLFGGARYEDMPEPEISGNQEQEMAWIRSLPFRSRSFNFLPGTEAEADTIARKLQSAGWEVSLYTGLAANETSLRNLSTKGILHIATHGFFFEALEVKVLPENAREQIELSDNPMIRSGLVFSGVNRVWRDQVKNIPPSKDGLFTAFELANQDWTAFDLVVLSACNTGLGEVVNGEGVFGLQRALQLAGVRKIIMSLWVANDQKAPALMGRLYDELLDGQSPERALNKAKKALKKEGFSPVDWGTFVFTQ